MQIVSLGDSLHEMPKPVFWEKLKKKKKKKSVCLLKFLSSMLTGNRIWQFMQIVPLEDNLHEMPKPISWK